MSEIKNILAREILDSRGNPTVEVDVFLKSGVWGRGSVPSGASTGSREALELRDGDKKRFHGLGVSRAVANVEERIFPVLENCECCDQLAIDRAIINLDGTADKSKLGANATLAVSIAAARAAANELDIPLYRHLGGFNAKILPVPMFNVFNGGRHANSGSAIQEFMIRPVGATCFSDAIEMGCAVFHSLKLLLKEKNLPTSVGDEGGFAARMSGGARAVIELLLKAIENSGCKSGSDIQLALDCASTEIYQRGIYDYSIFEGKDAPSLTMEEQVDFLESLVDDYPIDSIEDGMAESDWNGWKLLTERLGHRCQLVGDDLFVTNVEMIQRGINLKIANAVLIKPNQIGTLTETMDAIELARRSGYQVIVSHRSGETADTVIADLAVAVNAGQIKAGSLSRTDRVAKYNQLLRIEDQLGDLALYG